MNVLALLAGCAGVPGSSHGLAPVESQALRETGGSSLGSTACAPACIYVTDRTYPRNFITKVAVWAANADGNVPPVRRIFGASTKLKGSVGIAVDAQRNVYVLNVEPTLSVTVYGRDARGDAGPFLSEQ